MLKFYGKIKQGKVDSIEIKISLQIGSNVVCSAMHIQNSATSRGHTKVWGVLCSHSLCVNWVLTQRVLTMTMSSTTED